jgi:dCMP deaminase
MSLNKQEEKFLGMARLVSGQSPDPNTKNGAIITGKDGELAASGYNDFPLGVDCTPERLERPTKYLYLEHAERNALFFAARIGQNVEGGTLYISTLFPCADCARAAIQSGIKKIIAPAPNVDDAKWGDQFKAALAMLKEANVEIIYHSQNGK